MASPKHPRRVLSSAEVDPGDNLPPWPEWSDAVLAATQWSPPARPKAEEESEPFEDPAGNPRMPAELPAAVWVRPAELDVAWALRPGATGDPGTNTHLLISKTMRTIASALVCLEREARLRPFPIERQSDRFRAPAGPWKPWHHVYGPQAKDGSRTNPHGKYLVRLFYLGKWRRIMVDDLLPVDDHGRVLLPRSEPNNLLFPLLAKALLKIAGLSRSVGDLAADFSAVHCLTGWIPVGFPARGCDERDLWCVCCQLLGTTEEVAAAPGCCVTDSCPPDADRDLPAVESRVVFAVVLPLQRHSRSGGGDATLSATGCEDVLLVSEVRYDGALPDPLWKEYRWKRWACEKGIIAEVESKPVRSVRVFNPIATSLPQTSNAEDWMDFSTFVKLVRALEVFYKPSYFKYSLNAWTVSDLVQKPECAEDVFRRGSGSKDAKGGKKGNSKKGNRSKSASPSADGKEKSAGKSRKSSKTGGKRKKSLQRKGSATSVDEWTAQLDQKPFFFYLLIDSMTCKQLYVCLSAYDTTPSAYAQIFVGKFIWHSSSVAPIAFMLSTFGTKGFALTLGPGLHVFRIWHHMPRHFCLQIYSNTPFSTGTKIQIHQILTADSLSFQHYGSVVSQSFGALLNTTFGGEAHGQAYDRFMEALRPPQLTDRLAWPDYHKAHKQIELAFEESLTEMLAETAKSAEEFLHAIQACQALFLNQKFGEPTLKIVNRKYYDFVQDRRLSLQQKEIQRKEAATVEASVKKDKSPKSKKDKSPESKKEKSPKSPRNPSPKSPRSSKSGKSAKGKGEKSKGVTTKQVTMQSSLKCKEKSLLIGDPNIAIELVKRMTSKVPQLRKHYPFGKEDDYRLHFQDYTGEVRVTDEWTLLIRCVLSLHASKEVPCALHVWSPAKRLVLRLIDNDTGHDVPLGYVENCVAFLVSNHGGYTVCVYGWSTAPVEKWRLRVLGMSRDSMLHVCAEPCSPERVVLIPEQMQMTVHGYYVPNKTNLIARCRLEVYDDVTVLLRLHLSNPSVLCRFTVRDPEGTIVFDTTGLGHIIVPVFHLEGPNASVKGSRATLKEREGILESSVSDVTPSPPAGRVHLIEVLVMKESWPLTEEEIKVMLYYKEHLPDIYYRHSPERVTESRKSSKETILSGVEENSESEWFENAKKPSWSISVVTDLDKEKYVVLTPDQSAFEMLENLRQQWKQDGVDFSRCSELRKEFLDEFVEKGCERNEEDVFHLTAKRTARFVELYGNENVCTKADSSSRISSISSLRSSRVTSVTSSHSHSSQTMPRTLSMSLPSNGSARKSSAVYGNRISASKKSQKSDSGNSKSKESSREEHSRISDTEGRSSEQKPQHRNMIMRQAGIHRALEDRRDRNLEKLKEAYEETLALRLQVINNIRTANAGTESEKRGKKSKSSIKSPGRKKSPTSTMKGKTKK